ncbi:MAG: DUF805 domain-containing protein [Vicinamibacterales bacterium]
MSDTRYTLTRDGQQYGPYTLSQLRDYVAKGNVSAEDLVWATGMSSWTPVSRLLSQPQPRPPVLADAGAGDPRKAVRAVDSAVDPRPVTRQHRPNAFAFDRPGQAPTGFFSLFSMEGRYNRARYFWTCLAIAVTGYIVMFICAFTIGMILAAGGTGDISGAAGGFVGIVFGVAIQVVCAFQAVKRLHDIGRPGSHYWLLLIPFYNIYLGCLLLFKRGDFGANQYGADPLATAMRY